MQTTHILLLLGGGFVAGIINTMAGGGSLLTVPLLVFAGVGGNTANGSNRIGVLAGTLSAASTFRRMGVSGWAGISRILVPAVLGSLIGSILVTQLTDDVFERVFGLVMIPVLALSLRKPDPKELTSKPQWHPFVSALVFFGVGIYGGAIQAGVGLMLIAALRRANIDIVTTNHIKVIVTGAFTLFTLPVFILNGDVYWLPALVLAVGVGLGAFVGARITVAGGERVVRPVLVCAVVVMAGRLLGLY